MIDLSTTADDVAPAVPQTPPETLRARIDEVRHEAHILRETGRKRLFEAGTATLELAAHALGDVPEPLSPIAETVKKAVEGELGTITRNPIDAYDAMNVREVRAALYGLDLVDLARVDRYERAHKNRKTVYEGIAIEQRKRLRRPIDG